MRQGLEVIALLRQCNAPDLQWGRLYFFPLRGLTTAFTRVVRFSHGKSETVRHRCAVMIMTLGTGGVGLNLVEASHAGHPRESCHGGWGGGGGCKAQTRILI